MSHTPENRLTRARRRKAIEARRFDSRPAACLFCGLQPYAALVDPEKTRHFVEEHHALGRRFAPDVVVTLCLICHRLAGDEMLDEGWTARPSPNPVVTTDLVFRALAAFLRLLAEACAKYAQRLTDAIARLDAALPAWRAIAEGRAHG